MSLGFLTSVQHIQNGIPHEKEDSWISLYSHIELSALSPDVQEHVLKNNNVMIKCKTIVLYKTYLHYININ